MLLTITTTHQPVRYERDILDQEFISWLRNFSSLCKYRPADALEQQGVLNSLRWYVDYLDSLGLSERSFKG